MSSAHSPKILRQNLVADVAIGPIVIGPPPPLPTVSIVQAPVDILPDPATVLTEALTAQRQGDTSKASSLDWAVSAGLSPSVDGTDFGLAANVFPSGTFNFPAGATTATDQFNIAAKAPPSTDENAVFTLRNPINARILGAATSSFILQHLTVVTVPDITNIQQDTTKVFWVYTQPPNFTGYEIRTTTRKGTGWASCTVLVAGQTAKQILKSAIPSGVKEVLVKATIVGGQQSQNPARIDITGVVNKNYPSGLQWLSGLNPAGDTSPTGYLMSDAFVTWRGRAVDVWNIKGMRTGTWAQLVNSIQKSSAYQAAWSRNIRVEQVVPLIPQLAGVDDLIACGNTDVNNSSVQVFINAHTQIANWIAAQSIKSPFIIRLGHELEDGGNAYSVYKDTDRVNFSHYILCMQRACDIYHSIVGGPPNVYIDQCHLRATPPGEPVYAWDKYFPGSQYVDIGGMDAYCTISDSYTKPNTCKINNAVDMAHYLDDLSATGHPHGPRAAADWCIARGIKFGIGEWGISTPEGYPGYTDGAPGNPNDVAGTWYCQGMFDFFQAYQDTLIYESYFNIDDIPKGHLIVDYNTSTKRCSDYTKAPAASAAYRTRWTP